MLFKLWLLQSFSRNLDYE